MKVSILFEEVWTEIFFDELSHIICLSVDSQSLDLSHVLKEYIGRDLVVRIRSEAVLEIVEVEAEADESPHCLSRNAAEHSQLLQLTSRSKYALK